jgi:hypothetical protein
VVTENEFGRLLLPERETPMVRSLTVRREKIVRELRHVDRAIAATQKRLAEIQARLAVLAQPKTMAA